MNKTVDDIIALLNISADQILALFGKAVWKITNEILKSFEEKMTKELKLNPVSLKQESLRTDDFFFKDVLKTKKIQKKRE